jgi:carbonic anhydrase
MNNAAYAGSFEKGDLPLPPARGMAVVACMDARLDVHKILGLEEGDAHVIRNAGDVITDDEIRSRSPSAFSARARSSSSTTPTAGCSPSRTTISRRRSTRRLG